MDAAPLLALVARLLSKRKFDAVLIGNAAAALQGSPVTTQDLDFLFRKTPLNLRKLKRLADDLDALILRPFYPASGLYRVVRDRDGLQLDFMTKIDGIRSFEALRGRASRVAFGDADLLVASLPGRRWMKRKPASRRKTKPPTPLLRESERALIEQIRRLLALPPSKRTNFLRIRRPGGGSAI